MPTYGAQEPEELAAKVLREPAPTLRPGTAASPLFHHFIASALVKEPWMRPSAMDLAAHGFVAGALSARPLLECLARARV